MPDVPTSNPAQFCQSAPLLLVPDVGVIAAFYRHVLGFKSDPGADTPRYSVVWRDNAAGERLGRRTGGRGRGGDWRGVVVL